MNKHLSVNKREIELDKLDGMERWLSRSFRAGKVSEAYLESNLRAIYVRREKLFDKETKEDEKLSEMKEKFEENQLKIAEMESVLSKSESFALKFFTFYYKHLWMTLPLTFGVINLLVGGVRTLFGS